MKQNEEITEEIDKPYKRDFESDKTLTKETKPLAELKENHNH